jgi:hypothetical protein
MRVGVSLNGRAAVDTGLVGPNRRLEAAASPGFHQ